MAREYGRHVGMVTSAFFQDADSLLLPTEELIAILDHLKKRFPGVTRVTTYARASSMKRKSVEDYRRLKAAGLTRIHTGMESGSGEVLRMLKKGTTPEDIVQGGTRVMEAGISLSEYIMPGVAGKTLSNEHAVETARLLNAIKPNYIRVRTFAMYPGSPMWRMAEEGSYVPMTDPEIVAEIRLLLDHLDEMHSYFSCGDFSLNLLMQVDGYLDERKAAMLTELDSFLSLTQEQQEAYSLLRRAVPSTIYPIDVVRDPRVLDQVVPELEKLKAAGEGEFQRHLRLLMSYQLPAPQTDHWS